MNILAYAELSSLVYRKHSGKAGTMEYLRSEIGGAQVIAFRGTSKNHTVSESTGFWQKAKSWFALVRDVVYDIRIAPIRDPYLGWRPAGFLHAANDVLDEILPTLDEAKPIDLTGHSLGAACAALVGESLVRRGYWVRHIVLFGSPRCGKLKRLRSTYSTALVFSYQFGKDVVCSVPPFWKPPAPLMGVGVSMDRLSDHAMDNYSAWFRRYE